jgi:hypothetical protein
MSEMTQPTPHTVSQPVGGLAGFGGGQAPKPRTVQIFAVIGGAILLLQLYVWGRWITGPYFQRVPSGPNDPPMYMKIPLTANAIIVCVGLPIAIWWFLIRPWRRERRITLDGMLFGSTALMVFQDPLLNWFNTWCTYNTWLWNRGSWTPYIPGWVSPDSPGRQVPEPILVNAPGYAAGVLMLTIAGCAIMRKVKTRWPNTSMLRLVAITFAGAFVFDFVMEGLVLLPLGLYTYPGAIRSLSINAGTYYQWPVYEGLMWGAVQSALCCLRFFTDDRGRTIVERGLDDVRGGVVGQRIARFLAVFAAVSLSFFLLFNVPIQFFAMHGDPWPADQMKRSYFTGGICGAGTNVPCPDPSLPIPTRRSGYIDVNGKLVLPDGATMPTTVPFENGK